MPAFKQKISVATLDQREQVLDGSRKSDFVGYTRNPYGMAFPIGTANGKSFSDNISDCISKSMTSNNNISFVISTNINDSIFSILNKFKKAETNRLLLIICNKCYTDGVSPALLYDLSVRIYSQEGTLLNQKEFSGTQPLGGVTWGTSKNAEKHISNGIDKLLQQIFETNDFISALN